MNPVDLQVLFNAGVAIGGVIGGWMLNTLTRSLRDLYAADQQLLARIHAVETLIAGKYPTRDEFEVKIDALFKKLDRIEEKLDGKADK